MSAVRTILEELGVADKITAIGVAKGMDRDAGRERFFVGQASPTSRCRRAIRCFISSSGFGTRRTGLPSARTGPNAKRT
jgi:hypothetical protein